MSTFRISVEQLDKVWAHPNADRLELASIEGMSFQFVVAKGQHKAGDYALYFPVDSLLPEPLLTKLGLVGKLSGGSKNRVKTVKLRGEISQGLVGPLSLLDGLVDPADVSAGTAYHEHTGETVDPIDFAAALGVTKYEPPAPGTPGSAREPTLPPGVAHYDIEGCDRNKAAAELMMDWPVLIMEKVEGSHTALTIFPDGKTVVCSRNHALIQPEDHNACRWHKGCVNSDLFNRIRAIQAERFPGQQVTLRGELLGPAVQDNIYQLKDYQVLVFDLEVDGVPRCGHEFLKCMAAYECPTVPVLSAKGTLREWLGGRSIQTESNGFSGLLLIKREGIVIRPLLPEHEALTLRGVGRPVLKQRSPEYLANSNL